MGATIAIVVVIIGRVIIIVINQAAIVGLFDAGFIIIFEWVWYADNNRGNGIW